MAAFLFMRRMADVSKVSSLQNMCLEEDDDIAATQLKVPAAVEIFEVNGPFFFGAAEKVRTALQIFEKKPKVLIIRMRNVPAMDATGLYALETVCAESSKAGITILLSGVRKQPLTVLEKAGFFKCFDRDMLLPNVEQALDRAAEYLKDVH